MQISKKNTSKIVLLSVISMFLLSLLLGWVMGKNMSQDRSKSMFKLTKDYKEYKKEEYSYNKEKGANSYKNLCLTCHGKSGMGTSYIPPLKDSKEVQDNSHLIKVVLNGLTGTLHRGDKKFMGVMPAFKMLDHTELADTLNYIKSHFNASAPDITPVNIITAKIKYINNTKAIEASEL